MLSSGFPENPVCRGFPKDHAQTGKGLTPTRRGLDRRRGRSALRSRRRRHLHRPGSTDPVGPAAYAETGTEALISRPTGCRRCWPMSARRRRSSSMPISRRYETTPGMPRPSVHSNQWKLTSLANCRENRGAPRSREPETDNQMAGYYEFVCTRLSGADESGDAGEQPQAGALTVKWRPPISCSTHRRVWVPCPSPGVTVCRQTELRFTVSAVGHDVAGARSSLFRSVLRPTVGAPGRPRCSANRHFSA
jgi:hypothetical protein